MGLACVLVLLLHVCALQALTWQKIAVSSGGSPPGRQSGGLGFDSVTNRLILFGGKGGSSLNDLWLFDLNTQTWQESTTSATKPGERFSFISGVDSGSRSFLVSTGERVKGSFYRDVWSLNLDTLMWQELVATGDAPHELYGGVGGVTSGILLVSHGFGSKVRYDTTHRFNISSREWLDVSPPSRPHARCLGSGAVLSPDKTETIQMVLFGGCGSGGYGPCAAEDSWVFRYNPAPPRAPQGLWAKSNYYCGKSALKGVMAPLPSAVQGAEHMAILFGGSHGVEHGAGAIAFFDTFSGTWKTVKPSCDPVGGDCPSQEVWPHIVSSQDSVYLVDSGSTVWSLTGDFTPSAIEAMSDLGHCGRRFDYRRAHGIIMWLAWSFILPIGATIARHRKYFGDPLWFKLHMRFQLVGSVLQVVGFALALVINQTAKFIAVPHAMIGLIVGALGIIQPINGLLRPHKHPNTPKSLVRIWWERFHKGIGYVTVILGLLQPFWGLLYLSGSRNEGDGHNRVDVAFLLHSVWFAILVSIWVLPPFVDVVAARAQVSPKA